MDIGEAVLMVCTGVGGKAAFDFARDLIASRRSAKTKEAAADVSVLKLLADRVRGLEAAQVMERADCDRKLDGLRARHDECEARLAAIDGELREVRRSIGMHREDDTARLGPKGEKR